MFEKSKQSTYSFKVKCFEENYYLIKYFKIMKKLDDFKIEKTQLKNIQGGCRQTEYRVRSTGATGTDSWCDSNGDGIKQDNEVSNYTPNTNVVLAPPTAIMP